MPIKLIICLRNPGAAYTATRHNAGEWFAMALANHYNLSFKKEKKLHAESATVVLDNQTCKVLLPLTFMNHSGLAVQEACVFYQLQPDELLVVHDELDLPAGRIKLKTGGGHGGHNGLRDIIGRLSNTDFNRLRIGIGHPGNKNLVLDYVLGKPNQEDKELILTAIDRGLAIVPLLLADDFAKAMNTLNG